MAEDERSFADRTRYFAELLVGWPSVTGSPEEAEFSRKLVGELRTWSVFRNRPGDLTMVPAPGIHDRSSVMALVRGMGPRTVLLVGHFDTVSIDDYGELAPLAGRPDMLSDALIAKLRDTGSDTLALKDLESGDFVPGRGMLDMKSGLAAGLAVLERFGQDPHRVGNILLIACPDEEENSSGMRSVAAHLPAFLERHGLDARLTVNLDAICDNEDGATGRVVTMGCIGKLLLSAYVVGREAHACYPLDGVNAAYLAAELVTEMEYAPELGEGGGQAFCSPPTVLGLKDRKTAYDVTVPSRAWTFWNMLLHQRNPGQALVAFEKIVRRAMERAAERMSEKASRFAAGPALTAAWRHIRVMTYETLKSEALAISPGLSTELGVRAAQLATRLDLDLPTRTRDLIDFVWERSRLEGPAVVLCVGSMPYPPVLWPSEAREIEAAIDAAIESISSLHGETIAKHPFFPAIADMSFVGPVDLDGLAAVAANTPLWGSSIELPENGAWQLNIPAINAGPWGRDYHRWLERTHAGYTFRTLPALVDAIARNVLAL